MRREQKIVAIGAASGIAVMLLSVWLLTPLFVMIITIANSRFLSEAMDPTRHAESPTMQIDGRVAENTLQQNFVFAVASLAASTLSARQPAGWLGMHHRVRRRAPCLLARLAR